MCNISHIHVNKHIHTAEVIVYWSVCVLFFVRVLIVDWMQAEGLFFDGFIFWSKHHCCSVTEGEVKSDGRVFFIPPSLSRERERERDREEEGVSLYYQCVSVQDSEKNSSTKPERKDVSVQFCYIIPVHTLKLHLNKCCHYHWVLSCIFL